MANQRRFLIDKTSLAKFRGEDPSEVGQAGYAVYGESERSQGECR